MTFEDYIGKKLIGSADELDEELYEEEESYGIYICTGKQTVKEAAGGT